MAEPLAGSPPARNNFYSPTYPLFLLADPRRRQQNAKKPPSRPARRALPHRRRLRSGRARSVPGGPRFGNDPCLGLRRRQTGGDCGHVSIRRRCDTYRTPAADARKSRPDRRRVQSERLPRTAQPSASGAVRTAGASSFQSSISPQPSTGHTDASARRGETGPRMGGGVRGRPQTRVASAHRLSRLCIPPPFVYSPKLELRKRGRVQ